MQYFIETPSRKSYNIKKIFNYLYIYTSHTCINYQRIFTEY